MKVYYALFFLVLNLFAYDTEKTEKVFTDIFKSNFWADGKGGKKLASDESISGTGSNLKSTVVIRSKIPELVNNYNIKSLLDAPCGDLFWVSKIIPSMNLSEYIGIDIVEDLINSNKLKYYDSSIKFFKLDLINDDLPCVDLVLCRDCLLHFDLDTIILALKNLKKSGSKYILMTHFSRTDASRKFKNIQLGDWRPINFMLPPFNLDKPLEIITEGCTQSGFEDKCLGLWKLEDLSL